MRDPRQLDAATLAAARQAVTNLEQHHGVRCVLVLCAGDADNVDGHVHYISTLPRAVGIELLINVVDNAVIGSTSDVTPERPN